MAIPKEKHEVVNTSIIPPQVNQSHPWLVICGGWKKETQTFFSISKGRYYVRNIPELTNKKIFANYMEWLVLADYGNKECSLLNIISMEKVKLPKYADMNYCGCCNLTSSPEDPNCYIVFKDSMNDNICICQPGDDKFITRKMEPPEKDDKVRVVSTTCFRGNIYGVLSSSLSLIRANLHDPTLEFQTVLNAESLGNELLDCSTHYYLTESCGELLLVTKARLHEEAYVFHVFRADFSTTKWVLLRNIGDRAIFLEANSLQGTSCSSSESGIDGNCIYYTEGRNRSLYVFNLEDQSLTMSIPCPTINPINSVHHWVMIPPPNVSFDPFSSLSSKN